MPQTKVVFYQEADGTVTLPTVLRPYLAGAERISLP